MIMSLRPRTSEYYQNLINVLTIWSTVKWENWREVGITLFRSNVFLLFLKVNIFYKTGTSRRKLICYENVKVISRKFIKTLSLTQVQHQVNFRTGSSYFLLNGLTSYFLVIWSKSEIYLFGICEYNLRKRSKIAFFFEFMLLL